MADNVTLIFAGHLLILSDIIKFELIDAVFHVGKAKFSIHPCNEIRNSLF